MSSNSDKILGIDLGGTRIKTGLVDPQGNILLSKNFLTSAELGRQKALKRIVKIIKKLVKIYTQFGSKPNLIGIGAPGVIDRAQGIIKHSPNLPDWNEVPLAQLIAEEAGIPTFMDKDANVVTYGEKWIGAGQDFQNFVCLTLGTGVGSGLFLNGRPWFGNQGSGPEFGHVTIEPRGEPCGCGNRGCLETLASASHLVKRAQKGLDKKIPTLLGELLNHKTKPLTAKVVYEAARRGDPFCISLFADLGRYLGIALANMVHTLLLEGVILGGGLSKASTIFLPYLEKEFNKRLTMADSKLISIRISSLGEKSGILGAARMAKERQNK
ncbi:MAG: ROK family protein [Deltaproteobacteria bacterium]|nr:ROK family protein [Deltaproteobacteria bacterium]